MAELILQLGVFAFSVALVGMTYLIFQIYKFYSVADPLRVLGIGFLWLAINNFIVILSETGIIVIPYLYELTMLLAVSISLYGIYLYAKMSEKLKERF